MKVHLFFRKSTKGFRSLEEVFALGLRNPFRASVDTETGEIWVGDVGGENLEEISILKAGSNGQ